MEILPEILPCFVRGTFCGSGVFVVFVGGTRVCYQCHFSDSRIKQTERFPTAPPLRCLTEKQWKCVDCRRADRKEMLPTRHQHHRERFPPPPLFLCALLRKQWKYVDCTRGSRRRFGKISNRSPFDALRKKQWK